jgi:NADH dehydrogenase (ubiquinone) 1 beta subcomplex subunit 7
VPQDERHGYEKCQFAEYTRRVVKQDEMKAANGGARSN